MLMQVFECLLFGTLPEEVISEDLVAFVEDQIGSGATFKIKSVPKGTDPATITNGLIGYYPPYGIAYLSHPDAESGLTAIDIKNKRLIHARKGTPFFNQRDAFVYATPEHRYVRETFPEVLKEFQNNGYGTFEFLPEGIGDSLIRHKNFEGIQIGRGLHLNDLL